MRERSLPFRAATQFAVTLCIALVVGTIGPFGTFSDMPPGDRYLYWGISIPLNWMQILAAVRILAEIPRLAALPRAALIAAGCALASIPASFEVYWLEQWLRPGPIYPPTPVGLYPYVLLLSLVIALPLQRFVWPQQAEPDGPEAPTAQPSAFLRRIPAALGADLLCIQAEDHYLRVHTGKGNDLILHRMADALAELEAEDGLQVHRSSWVARAAVAEARRDGKRVTLVLTNGLEIPVSRTFLPRVREAGWLG